MGVAPTSAADTPSHVVGQEPAGDVGDESSLSVDGVVAQADDPHVPIVEYCGHVQNVGWKPYVSDEDHENVDGSVQVANQLEGFA
jgi:hypothetical protein